MRDENLLPITIDQLNTATRVRIARHHIRRENVIDVIVAVLRLQTERQRIADRNRRRRPALVQNHQANLRAHAVLGWQVFNRYRTSRS